MADINWFVWLLMATLVAGKVERPGDHIVAGSYEVSVMVIIRYRNLLLLTILNIFL